MPQAGFPDSTFAPDITRPMLEAEIERLIELLDRIDPDPDLEADADSEPSLVGAHCLDQRGGF